MIMTIAKEKQKKRYSITRDSGANVKILKRLQNAGFIKIYDVMLENGRENTKKAGLAHLTSNMKLLNELYFSSTLSISGLMSALRMEVGPSRISLL